MRFSSGQTARLQPMAQGVVRRWWGGATLQGHPLRATVNSRTPDSHKIRSSIGS